MVKDIVPDEGSSVPDHLINVNGILFFTANDGAHGVELWKTDGTAERTVVVKDIRRTMPAAPRHRFGTR